VKIRVSSKIIEMIIFLFIYFYFYFIWIIKLVLVEWRGCCRDVVNGGLFLSICVRNYALTKCLYIFEILFQYLLK